MSAQRRNWEKADRERRMAQRGTEQAYGKVELRAGTQGQEAMLVSAARGGLKEETLRWLDSPEPPLPDPSDGETPSRSEWHLAVLGPYEPTAAYYREPWAARPMLSGEG